MIHAKNIEAPRSRIPSLALPTLQHTPYNTYLGNSESLKVAKYDCSVLTKSNEFAGAMLSGAIRCGLLTTTAPFTRAISSPKSDHPSKKMCLP